MANSKKSSGENSIEEALNAADTALKLSKGAVDVESSVESIQSFKELIKDPKSQEFSILKAFMKKEHSQENMQFIEAMHEFKKSFSKRSSDVNKSRIAEIYNKFIKDSQDHNGNSFNNIATDVKINLPAHLKREYEIIFQYSISNSSIEDVLDLIGKNKELSADLTEKVSQLKGDFEDLTGQDDILNKILDRANSLKEKRGENLSQKDKEFIDMVSEFERNFYNPAIGDESDKLIAAYKEYKLQEFYDEFLKDNDIIINGFNYKEVFQIMFEGFTDDKILDGALSEVTQMVREDSYKRFLLNDDAKNLESFVNKIKNKEQLQFEDIQKLVKSFSKSNLDEFTVEGEFLLDLPEVKEVYEGLKFLDQLKKKLKNTGQVTKDDVDKIKDYFPEDKLSDMMIGGKNLLHHALEKGNIDAAKVLVKGGFNVNAKDSIDKTAVVYLLYAYNQTEKKMKKTTFNSALQLMVDSGLDIEGLIKNLPENIKTGIFSKCSRNSVLPHEGENREENSPKMNLGERKLNSESIDILRGKTSIIKELKRTFGTRLDIVGQLIDSGVSLNTVYHSDKGDLTALDIARSKRNNDGLITLLEGKRAKTLEELNTPSPSPTNPSTQDHQASRGDRG